MALPKKHRLVSKLDFDKVFKRGKAVKGSFLFIKSRVNEFSFSRFGFVIPKRTYPRAVDRNRLKRVLIETVAPYVKSLITKGRDFIIVINKRGKEDLVKKELTSFFR